LGRAGVHRHRFSKSLLSQVGIILLSDVVSEYIADYAKSTPLSYLH
jgi:hypothetical protein